MTQWIVTSLVSSTLLGTCLDFYGVKQTLKKRFFLMNRIRNNIKEMGDFQLSQQLVACISPEIYLIVVSFTAFTVPATWHTFDHFLPFTCTTWDAAYRGWERWVACFPTHGLDLGEERRGEENWRSRDFICFWLK